jgi:hypothetical protein
MVSPSTLVVAVAHGARSFWNVSFHLKARGFGTAGAAAQTAVGRGTKHHHSESACAWSTVFFMFSVDFNRLIELPRFAIFRALSVPCRSRHKGRVTRHVALLDSGICRCRKKYRQPRAERKPSVASFVAENWIF